MLKTYQILSLLADYPTRELAAAFPLLKEEIKKEGLLLPAEQEELDRFLAACSRLSPEAWQMMYVQQFDCAPAVNLYLFDHLYGSSRERGQAMVDLKTMYGRAGFTMASTELPDYLPLFLEYMALAATPRQAAELLGEVKPILRKIQDKLEEAGHFYRHLLSILTALAASAKEGDGA